MFSAGVSNVYTIEQVYYRYVYSARPPYGRLERYVRYDNTPDDSFPPSSPTWTLIANHLTDFSIEYQTVDGNVLAGNPLSAANRGLVARIVFYLEGFDANGPTVGNRLVQIESAVLIRNAAL